MKQLPNCTVCYQGNFRILSERQQRKMRFFLIYASLKKVKALAVRSIHAFSHLFVFGHSWYITFCVSVTKPCGDFRSGQSPVFLVVRFAQIGECLLRKNVKKRKKKHRCNIQNRFTRHDTYK